MVISWLVGAKSAGGDMKATRAQTKMVAALLQLEVGLARIEGKVDFLVARAEAAEKVEATEKAARTRRKSGDPGS